MILSVRLDRMMQEEYAVGHPNLRRSTKKKARVILFCGSWNVSNHVAVDDDDHDGLLNL